MLPGTTFVKTFLRTYAEQLGLDPHRLVEEYRAALRAARRARVSRRWAARAPCATATAAAAPAGSPTRRRGRSWGSSLVVGDPGAARADGGDDETATATRAANTDTTPTERTTHRAQEAAKPAPTSVTPAGGPGARDLRLRRPWRGHRRASSRASSKAPQTFKGKRVRSTSARPRRAAAVNGRNVTLPPGRTRSATSSPRGRTRPLPTRPAALRVSARAGIVVTGTEVLTGRVQDRNGPWLSDRLLELGVELAHITICGDRPGGHRGASCASWPTRASTS